jgi:nitrogen regulatory protein PII
MKAIFISYNQSITFEVQQILDDLNIKGYTQWIDVKGRGSVSGEPHEGTHTWPEMNNAHIVMVDDEKVDKLLNCLERLDKKSEQQGLRAFVWKIENEI